MMSLISFSKTTVYSAQDTICFFLSSLAQFKSLMNYALQKSGKLRTRRIWNKAELRN